MSAALDIRLSCGLPGHWKTKIVIGRLGAAGAWHLVRLLLWVRENKPDGALTRMTDAKIELVVDWAGEPGAFVAALVEADFLEGEECSRVLHDWAEHQPWAVGATTRSGKARWAALCKRHGREEAAKIDPKLAARYPAVLVAGVEHASSTELACQEHAKGLPVECHEDAPSPSPSPSPIPPPPPPPRARDQYSVETPTQETSRASAREADAFDGHDPQQVPDEGRAFEMLDEKSQMRIRYISQRLTTVPQIWKSVDITLLAEFLEHAKGKKGVSVSAGFMHQIALQIREIAEAGGKVNDQISATIARGNCVQLLMPNARDGPSRRNNGASVTDNFDEVNYDN